MTRLAVPLAAVALFTAGCTTTPEPEDPAPSLGFEEQAAATAVLRVYDRAHQLTVQAWTDPAQDWDGEYVALTGDPYRSDALADLAAAAGRGDAYTGTLDSDPTVTAVDLVAGVIAITDCLDPAGWQLINTATGQPQPDADAAAAGPHVVESEIRRAEGRWLLVERTEQLDQPC